MESVTAWLEKLKLEQYINNFMDGGYDTPAAIMDLDEEDLDAIGVTLPGHKKRLLVAAKRYSNAESAPPIKVVKPVPSYQNWAGAGAGSFDVAPEEPIETPAPKPKKRSFKVNNNAPPTQENTSPDAQAPVTASAASSVSASSEDPLPEAPKKPPAAKRRVYNPQPAEEPKPPVVKKKLEVKDTIAKRTSMLVEATIAAASAPKLPDRNPGMKSEADAGTPPKPVSPAVAKKPAVSKTIDEPKEGDVEILIEDDDMGVMRKLFISKSTTVVQAIEMYLQKYNKAGASDDGTKVWGMYEAFMSPNVERLLSDAAILNTLMSRWPKSVDTGCRFLLRAVDVETTNSATAAMTGMMEKRGGGKGGAKSWKARHFRIEENGLVYYKTEPISKKQLASPLGTWSITGWTIFLVKGQIRKGKTAVYLALREDSTPIWAENANEANDQLNLCKLMSVPDEKTALTWMVSIQIAQGISGEAVESARRERLATVSALPASVPGADEEAAVASSDEDVTAADTAAMRMTPVDPEDATKLAKRISHVPTDYKPIQAKKVMGVGFGNIFGQLPEAASTQSKQGTTEASPASRPPAVLPPTTE